MDGECHLHACEAKLGGRRVRRKQYRRAASGLRTRPHRHTGGFLSVCRRKSSRDRKAGWAFGDSVQGHIETYGPAALGQRQRALASPPVASLNCTATAYADSKAVSKRGAVWSPPEGTDRAAFSGDGPGATTREYFPPLQLSGRQQAHLLRRALPISGACRPLR